MIKIVKLALDVTEAKLKSARDASLLQAIFRSQAVIEFDLNAVILDANENFLKVVGYDLHEIVGQKHSIFLEPDYAVSAPYLEFWDALRRGEFLSGEFCRKGKGGKPVWLEASYNPIFDIDGKVVRVVKFATDLTERMANVAEVGGGLSRLSKGDLEVRVERTLIPSLDQLRIDFNSAADNLNLALRNVAAGGSAIQSASVEISESARELSQRTEQQAARLEETAASLDDITTAVRKTAEGAVRASGMVAGAKAEAETSGGVVRDAVKAMHQIEASSKSIGQIIGVIDEIAFQTNLLALNAGVEAARAGDAGRGFAVVAQEVRALAQRSAEAAKEIKALISASSRNVVDGVDLVGQAGDALVRIVSQVTEIDGVVSEISASAQKQATGLSEVNTAVNQMDQMTQQNAAMVEETTAASVSLADEGQELMRLISGFQLGTDVPIAVKRRPRAAGRPPKPSGQSRNAAPVRAMVAKASG